MILDRVAPAPAEKFSATLAAGCAIVSATRPSLNGTYAIDAEMQRRFQAIANGIANSRGFPHNAATYDWPVAGGKVTFSSTAEFLDVASAIEAYVSDLLIAEAAESTGNPATWPAQPVTIP